MFKHILVPADGSTLSHKAVKQATALARGLNGKETVLHVFPKFAGGACGRAVLLGSETNRVATHSEIPVLVLR